MPFLNVVYGGTPAEIKTDGIERIGQLQDTIKDKYGDFIAAPPVAIQLYKSYSDEEEKGDAIITDLEEIPEEYFKKRKDGGLALEIRTSPPPSKQSSNLHLAPQSSRSDSERRAARKRAWDEMRQIKPNLDQMDELLDSQLLTLNLEHRHTRTQPSSEDNIKLLLGPSGCGKTRFCLELLYANHGLNLYNYTPVIS